MKRIAAMITALAICLMIPFAVSGEVKAVDKEENGKVSETTWQDENGQPAAGPEGYATVKYAYRKDNTFEVYYDAEGQLYRTEGGYCGRRVKRDGKGNTVEIEYLDEEGERTLNRAGYGMVVMGYTSFGEVNKVSYFGTGKKTVTVPSLGYATVETAYSGKTMTSRTYKDEKGNPVDCADGYAVKIRKLNKKYQVISVRYDHADGKPATGPDGWHRCRTPRDDKGRVTSVSYYDVNDEPIDRGAGYAREEYTYEGNNVKVIRYGLDGEVVADAAGVAVTVREMKDDRIVKEYYLDKDGSRTANAAGVGETLYSYDHQGALEKVSFQDTEGKPALCSEGYAGYRDVKDEDGATVSRTFLGTDGTAIEIPAGYSEIRYVYDEAKQLTSIRYYDLNGKQAQ